LGNVETACCDISSDQQRSSDHDIETVRERSVNWWGNKAEREVEGQGDEEKRVAK
jgi:hypothetical protein